MGIDEIRQVICALGHGADPKDLVDHCKTLAFTGGDGELSS